MLRYCTNCKKDIDFPPRAITAKEDLICPECGSVVPKNSRNPEHGVAAERSEEAIGRTYAILVHLAYVFYITLAVIGIAGYFTGAYMLLYVGAGIALFSYALQCLTMTTSFPTGVIFIPLGAIVTFFVFKNPRALLLGVCFVFLIRHVVRDIFYRLIMWIVKKAAES
jgi:DNA-directed RNA polymerase subunit RPC12/RpoP